MGIEEYLENKEHLDADVLRWPKRFLAAIYFVLALWSSARILLFEMYQEEFVIRLIFIAFMVPLSGFILLGKKWAMSSAYTVLLCYFGAFYLVLELRLSIGLLVFLIFTGSLTFRAMTAMDQTLELKQKLTAEVFE